MLESKEYVAIQDFSVSLDNGKTPTYIKKGETLTFDGLNVTIREERGTARPLSKVIGEWISPIGTPITPPEKKLASTSRNVSAGRIMEHSDYPSDPVVGVRNQPSDSVETLLKTYDRTPEVKLVNGKREVTSDLDDARKEVRLINSDDSVVRKVTASDGAPVTNKSGVEIDRSEDGKKAILTTDGQIVKKTNHSGKEATTGERKKLTVDYDASGVEVRKVASNKPAVTKTTVGVETVETDVEVSETSYPATQTTDVGSSTQAHIEQHKTVKKSPAKKKVAKKKTVAKKVVKKEAVAADEVDDSFINGIVNDAPTTPTQAAPVASTKPTKATGPVISSDGQEAVVIAKVTRDSKSSVVSEDGIVSRVKVGASEDMDIGEVQFSSGGDFEEPTAKFGPGEDTVYDALGADEAQIIESSDDDLDLNDLLSEA